MTTKRIQRLLEAIAYYKSHPDIRDLIPQPSLSEQKEKKPKTSPLKGRKGPTTHKYLPPVEIMRTMTKEDLAKWRKEERVKRNKLRRQEIAVKEKQRAEQLQKRLELLKDMHFVFS